MKKWSVPVTIEICGSVEVSAENPKEAIQRAKEAVQKSKRDTEWPEAIETPTVDTTYAYGDDTSSVEEAE